MRVLLLAGGLFAFLAGSAAAAAPSDRPVFVGCKAFTAPHARPDIRPRKIMVACKTGSFYLSALRWRSWGTVADASGLANRRGHAYPVEVRLSRVLTCRHRGKRTNELTIVAWRYTGARPKGAPAVASQRFACR